MSEITNFYVSWLGNASFGANSVKVKDPEPLIFRPTDISGCVMWLDANDNSTVIYNDVFQVTQWNNKGTLGGGFDLSGAGLVEYGTSTVNGLNVVSFKPYGFMTGTYAFNFQARSVFLVTKPKTFPTATTISIFSSDTNGCQETFFAKNGTWVWFEGKHPSPIPTTAFETATDYTGYANLASFVLNTDVSGNWTGINGSYIAPIYEAGAAGYTTTSATYFLGNFFGGSAINADVDFCEIIMYNNAVSNVEREEIEAYLRAKWALLDPVPVFSPTDIAGLQIWMDANNTSTITTSGSNILTWSNLGAVSNVFSNDSNSAAYIQDSNGMNVVAMPSATSLTTYAQLPYYTRTSFAVFETVSNLSTLTYPYQNIWACETSGGLQLGVSYDSNTARSYMQMCQQGLNCPVVGEIILPIGGYNLAIWGTDSNTTASTIAYFNGGSNINTGTDLGNLFNTAPISFGMGSPVNDSPAYRVGEIIEYDSLLTTSNISTVANYLVTKWAISSFTALS